MTWMKESWCKIKSDPTISNKPIMTSNSFPLRENRRLIFSIETILSLIKTLFFCIALEIVIKLSEFRKQSIAFNCAIHSYTKGQLISKAKCQAVDSPKKRTNEFAFFWLEELLRSKVKRPSFVFLEKLRLDNLLSKLSDLYWEATQWYII